MIFLLKCLSNINDTTTTEYLSFSSFLLQDIGLYVYVTMSSNVINSLFPFLLFPGMLLSEWSNNEVTKVK